MQIRHVARIEVAFVGLEVIALVKNFGHEHVARWRKKRFVSGEKRRFARSHVGKNNPGSLLAWIGQVMDFLAKPLPGRLAGLLEAVAVDVIKPAMIKTAESAVFDAAVAQIGPAMRTMQPEQTRAGLRSSRKRTRSSLKIRTGRGAPFSGNSSDKATGCQYCRSKAPPGVPGAVRVNRSFSAWVSILHLEETSLESDLDCGLGYFRNSRHLTIGYRRSEFENSIHLRVAPNAFGILTLLDRFDALHDDFS